MREKLRGEVRGVSACLNILLSSEQLRAGESSLCYVIASPKWESLSVPMCALAALSHFYVVSSTTNKTI